MTLPSKNIALTVVLLLALLTASSLALHFRNRATRLGRDLLLARAQAAAAATVPSVNVVCQPRR